MAYKVFVLDDDPNGERLSAFRQRFVDENGCDLTIARNADEAISIFKKDMDFDIICLDHDLSEKDQKVYRFGKGTGTEVASFLAGNMPEEQKKWCYVVIHSTNSVGAATMFQVLDSATIHTVIRPLLWLKGVFDATIKIQSEVIE